jgi:hypothetical protein
MFSPSSYAGSINLWHIDIAWASFIGQSSPLFTHSGHYKLLAPVTVAELIIFVLHNG